MHIYTSIDMKKQVNNKFQGTKFQVIPKHSNTFPFAPGIDIAEITKMPAYNSAGKEYERHLKPLRDLLDIDPAKLATIATTIDPLFNITDIQLNNGVCIIPNWCQFRYKDLFHLLQNLRQENRFKGSNDQIKEIKVKYYESDRY